MADIMSPFIIGALIVVIVVQAVERYFQVEQLHKEQSRLIAAVLSKNVTEYTQAVKAEKQPPQLPVESDEVELENASDETFDKFLEQQAG